MVGEIWNEVVCIASGPSLTEDDCDLVYKWRKADDTRRVLVTNLTFRLVPWADVLYAMDRAWWSVYAKEVVRDFQGKRFSRCNGIRGVTRIQVGTVGSHSGADAIRVAARFGARKIILLGYDAKHSKGRAHWHADYRGGRLGNAASVKKWPSQLRRVAREVKAEILNASRETAVDAFPRVDLEDALRCEDVECA